MRRTWQALLPAAALLGLLLLVAPPASAAGGGLPTPCGRPDGERGTTTCVRVGGEQVVTHRDRSSEPPAGGVQTLVLLLVTGGVGLVLWRVAVRRRTT